jgi:hypothetical protein
MQEIKIKILQEPFPHAIIENFYTEEELILIWKELDFLTSPKKFELRTSTASLDGKSLSTSVGICLDEIYNKREISDILTINRKVFDSSILKSFSSVHPLMRGVLDVNSDETLIRYYEHCDIYDGHYDHARFTVASYFYKEPKAFTGGDLHFEDFNYTISIKNNMVVFFVGNAIKHSSTHLIMNNDLPKFNGMGKYSMMQFLNTNKVYSDKNV